MPRKSKKWFWFRFNYVPGDGKDGLGKPEVIIFRTRSDSLVEAWAMIHNRRGLKALRILKTFEELGGFITQEHLTPGFVIKRRVIRRIFVPLCCADRKDKTIF